MGTQIAYGNVAGVIDVASARTAGAVYTLANSVTPNKLFTANISTAGVVYKAYAFGNGAAATTGGNNYVATTTLIPTTLSTLLNLNKTVSFANTQLKNAFSFGGASDGTGNLTVAFGTIVYNTNSNINKLANSVSRVGSTTIQTNMGAPDYLGNLLVGVSTSNNYINSNKLYPYTPRTNSVSNAYIVSTATVDVAANLRVAMGEYFFSNGIYLVTHTGGFSGLAGAGSGGGGGLTGKIESWT
jgi:hypothetical protein